MSSGGKALVINTRERAASNDINRAQAFASQQIAEAFRWLALATQGEGGASVMGDAITSPLNALVLNGLWARPEIGGTNLFIERGALAMIDPDASPSDDDSACKLIVDAGSPLPGVLTLTPGAGSTRIDVIECARAPGQILETDNRDIYDPATGLFNAVAVTKVKADALTYRIRTGTPGGGFPGTASGWLPLAVASVPAAAVTWNDVTLWDVRPLMPDLVRPVSRVTQAFPRFGKAYGSAYDDGAKKLFGVFETEAGPWRVGGEIGSALSGLTGGALGLLGADVVEPGFAAVGSLPWYLYALTPFGLPRWAKYSPASTGSRQPQPIRGVLVFTQKAPTFAGAPASAVALPTASGLGSNTTSGAVLATGGYDNGGTFLNASYADGWTYLSGFLATLNPASGANTPDPIYEIQDGTHFPKGATVVRVRVTTTLTGTPTNAGFDLQRSVKALDGASVTIAELGFSVVSKDSKSTGVTTDHLEIDVPLHAVSNMPTGATVTRRLHVAYSINGLVVMAHSNQSLRVVGWRMGM